MSISEVCHWSMHACSLTGVKDSSGFLITYSRIAPTYKAGVLIIGHVTTPLMIIPPRDPSFSVWNMRFQLHYICKHIKCLRNTECWSIFTHTWIINFTPLKAIPSTGINIFANMMHTHLVGISVVCIWDKLREKNTFILLLQKGRAVTLRHLRMNSSCGGLQELPPVDQNMQYDFNFQQTNLLTHPVNVLPVS